MGIYSLVRSLADLPPGGGRSKRCLSCLRGPSPPRWPCGKGGNQGIVLLSRQVVRQMPQCQVDHIAVVRVLLARRLGQVEPEAMDQLDIVLRELGRVRPEVKDVCPAVRGDDTEAEGPPRSVRHLFPGLAEPSGLFHWRQHGRAAGHDLDRIQLQRGEDRGLEDV